MEREQATKFMYDLLRLMLSKKGSDLFITAEFPPAFKIDGKVRSGSIPGVLSMSVEPLPTMAEGGEIWTEAGHPVNPKKLALATGRAGSTYADYGLTWDNSGRNGHYAAINWSN